MKNIHYAPLIFFDASVILAGLKSPQGGSGQLLHLAKKRKIQGIISEIVLNEVLRNTAKINLSREFALRRLRWIFGLVLKAPERTAVDKYERLSIDSGDCHLLASAKESKTEYLVSLDKKHILVLRPKIKWTKIVSPGEFLRLQSVG